MDQNRIVTHRLDQPVQDTYEPGAIRRANVHNLRKWVDAQSDEVQAHFCEHGSYSGHDRALAYLCPLCPET